MKKVEQNAAEFLAQHSIDNDSILIGCSGGVDSMVLLHTLLKLGKTPVVAHCNFQLRAGEADKDEEFVRAYCAEQDLLFFSTQFETSAYAATNGISIQMAARELRYSYFGELMKTHSLDFLCTAHHADDSLETIILNLGRGTGLTGMAGIRPKNGSLIRPLHRCSKQDILEYATAENLDWREDASNKKEDYQRNYIRHQVAPVLRKAFPSFESSFGKSLNYLNQDRELFEQLLQKELDLLVVKNEGKWRLPISKLLNSASPEAMLRHWLTPKAAFDISAIYQSLSAESGAIFEAENWQLLKDREFLALKKMNEGSSKEFLIDKTDGIITAPIALKMEKIRALDFKLDTSKANAALDFDKLEFPLKLRHWKKGDRFYPLGMKGAKKLSDHFVDRKYSRFDKEEAWLLCSGNEIVWIVNDRIDDRFKLSDTTKTVYFVRLL